MKNPHPAPILLIEDDENIVASLTSLIESELCRPVVSLSDGLLGLERALAEEHSVVIVDAGLPSLSGFEICRALRAERPAQAIMFLTGRNNEIDKVLGLELGADDYVTKPFSPREVAARLKALIRRSMSVPILEGIDPVLEVRGLRIDRSTRRVWVDGTLATLTNVEFDLLVLLAENPGRIFSRAELLESVLGYTSDAHDETLTVHFSNLRAKVEKNPRRPELLKTVRGLGYRFAAPDEQEEI